MCPCYFLGPLLICFVHGLVSSTNPIQKWETCTKTPKSIPGFAPQSPFIIPSLALCSFSSHCFPPLKSVLKP